MKDFQPIKMCSQSAKSDKSYIAAQRGNVLFLILITVVLFAALSYAVTQSSQTGVGSNDTGAGEVNAAQLNQFPNFVRAQTMRMMMRRIEVTDLEFNPPSEFGALTSTDVGVFHPSFGTNYVNAPASVMASGGQGQWAFNMNFEIESIGTSQAGNFGGNDLIAFLPGVTASACLRVNELLTISAIPTINDASYLSEAEENMDNTYATPVSETVIGTGTLAALEAEPFGCFQETVSGEYIYYFSIFER